MFVDKNPSIIYHCLQRVAGGGGGGLENILAVIGWESGYTLDQ